MRSLFSRVFAILFASLFIVVFVLSGIFVFAVQRSIETWNVHRGRRLQNVMVPELSRVYRQTGRLSEDAIHRAISPFLTSDLYVYVTNAQRQAVYLFVRGDRVAIHDTEEVNRVRNELEGKLTTPVPLLDGGTTIGYLHADTFGFRQDLANQSLLRSMFTTVLGGTIASLCAALLVALFFSRVLSNQARTLSHGIRELAAGRRDVELPSKGASELRTIATSVDKLQSQLSREEHLRRRWTQDIAHDLRTPITALKTQFEGLTDGVMTPTPERLHALYEEVKRMEGLVNDFRELSRIESPEITLHPIWIQACDFVSSLTASFEERARERDATFTPDCRAHWLYADEHLIHRAVTNILDNAVEHVEPEGNVGLLVETWESETRILVSNTGTISEEEVDLMFERSYRGDNSRNSEGSGLGLSIASAIVTLHKGSIHLRQSGSETHAEIRFPQADASLRNQT